MPFFEVRLSTTVTVNCQEGTEDWEDLVDLELDDASHHLEYETLSAKPADFDPEQSANIHILFTDLVNAEVYDPGDEYRGSEIEYTCEAQLAVYVDAMDADTAKIKALKQLKPDDQEIDSRYRSAVEREKLNSSSRHRAAHDATLGV